MLKLFRFLHMLNQSSMSTNTVVKYDYIHFHSCYTAKCLLKSPGESHSKYLLFGSTNENWYKTKTESLVFGTSSQ